MNLPTVFQVSIYGLTGLAGAMLSFGEEAPVPAGLTVVLCVLALFLNERLRLIRIGLLWCNLLGLVAMGFAVYEFLGPRLDSRLLAGAHFLVYLTWIVLFQDKRIQQYWWLFALGLLQVAVGSVLTTSGWYGLFLLGYLLSALWTMALFHVYQGALAFRAEGLDATLLHPAPPSAPKTPSNGPVGVESATRGVAAFPALPRSAIENTIQQDIRNGWITPRFVSGVTGISVMGLALGLVLFLLVPRFWLGSGNPFRNKAEAGNGALAGFTSEVKLGHLGRILESSEPVLQLRLFDQATNAPISLERFASQHGLEEPLFRGSVLDTYESGRWSRPSMRVHATDMNSKPGEAGMIRQEYRMERKGAEVLFALAPNKAGRLEPDDRIQVDLETWVLMQQSERDPLEYILYSPGSTPRDPGSPVMPGQLAYQRPMSEGARSRVERERHLQMPAGLERLRALASDWTAPHRLGGDPRLSIDARKAWALQAHLRDSGEYSYSLNMSVNDPQSDPVEDFLINRKSGHCEYYASALALMLRAVGIPARLVTGFKGAEFFRGNNYYEVQQRHAHAWVEAYVSGQWLVLDATPGEREESVKNFASRDNLWNSARSSLSAFWSNYVVSMSYSRQKESLYDPLTGGLGSLRSAWAAAERAMLRFRDQLTDPRQLLSWEGAGLLLSLLVVPLLAIGLLRRGWAWRQHRLRNSRRPGRWARSWRSWIGRWWGERHGPTIVIRFYERFLSLASSRGLRPLRHQTPREFARQVEASLAEALGSDGLATLPADVTESYYRVRFGGADLPADEISRLDSRMQRFAERLQGARKT